MKGSKEHMRILETLSLAASDTRQDTLISIIVNVLFHFDQIAKDDFCSAINELYGFEPYKDELFQIIETLVANNRISIKEDTFLLTDEEKLRLQELDTHIKDQEKARFMNFKNFINDNLNESLEVVKVKFLWSVFIDYIYNNFYTYGVDALKRLHPYINTDDGEFLDGDCLQIAYTKLKDQSLCDIFKKTIEQFPDYASAEDIDFLNDLAQKTLSFASLGVSPDMAETDIDRSIIDWVLYLDTNVLYSLLNLHSHPENDACKALISLIHENKNYLKIVLRYSELTKKELNSKREDFELLDDKLTNSSIKALLRSERLDDFSKQFYDTLLNDRESTLHPLKVIDLAPHTLLKNDIDIARNQKRVEQLGEDYLNTRIQDYRRYIDELNAIKQEFNKKNNISFREIYRSDKQITHDITLREIILDQRSLVLKKQETLNLHNAKYFGITLDEVLLKFDKNQLKDYNDARSFPVFFKPSFLLNKLVRVLPIKTADYKKAFLKAVASRGFNKDVQKSHDILKIVNYLKSQGIDDEQIIYNLISEDLFLEKYKKNKSRADFNQGEFIESEINKTYKNTNDELLRIKHELEIKSDEVINTSKISEGLEEKKNTLEGELALYKRALIKLKSDVEILKNQTQSVSTQQQINFDAGESQTKAEGYKKQLKSNLNEEITLFKKQSLRRWQRGIWWNLFWVVPLTFFWFYFIMFSDLAYNKKIDSNSLKYLISFFTLLFDGIFIFLIRNRYWDEGNKQKKCENIEPPKDITDRLKELE